MPNVDRVSALEIRDPMPFFIDVKPNDPSRRPARRGHGFGAKYTLGTRRSR